jgi:hypothetical protein
MAAELIGRVLVAAALGQLTQDALGQSPSDSAAGASDKQTSATGEYVKSLEVLPLGGDQRIAVIDRPLFSYSDAARIIAEGGIWAWGNEGRPVAMAKAWKNRNGSLTCAFSLTSDERLVARGPQFSTWKPEGIQVAPATLSGAAAPDPQNAGRLRQLKEQARRFTAHEFWNPDNSRFELRLLNQPVHRYQDEKRQIIDGAVFLLAYDNNPQILLLLEILGPAEKEARWQYALARASSAELHVALDGKEIWAKDRTPGIVGRPDEYYWHMVTAPETVIRPRPSADPN